MTQLTKRNNLFFTHPEARFIGLPPSLREEMGKNTGGVMGVSSYSNTAINYFVILANPIPRYLSNLHPVRNLQSGFHVLVPPW
jgi:hypothetical protein